MATNKQLEAAELRGKNEGYVDGLRSAIRQTRRVMQRTENLEARLDLQRLLALLDRMATDWSEGLARNAPYELLKDFEEVRMNEWSLPSAQSDDNSTLPQAAP